MNYDITNLTFEYFDLCLKNLMNVINIKEDRLKACL